MYLTGWLSQNSSRSVRLSNDPEQHITYHIELVAKSPLLFFGAPESPRDCAVTNQSSHSLSVECEPGYDGGLSQTFHLELYNSVVEHLAANLTRTDAPAFKVHALPPGTAFVLVLYASNGKGKSNSVALMASTLPPPERRTEEDVATVSPILGILIGVVAVLVVVAIVIIIIVRIQSSKRLSKVVAAEMMFEMEEKMKIATSGIEGGGRKLPSQKSPIKLGSELRCEALHCHGLAKFPLSACRVFCFESLCVAFALFGRRVQQFMVDPRVA
ncbi:hypothetical protein AVEN_121385-1 [Araneus ventricosus]|uniref:Fibronectin type-III domain-containing protein n=1 Tax=Araneus ventricosus TaxID=182803 RepID=A0A4Y2CST6_ARAVE|nr:hypothetical protein AVEN_121385-1 [Araneus ventricosus]